MVDTGSRLPILIRSKFIPTTFLTKAEIPAKIVTADNFFMDRGTQGCYMSIVLPI